MKPAKKDGAATADAPAAAGAQPVIAPRPRTLSSLRSKPQACVRLTEAFVHPPISPATSPAASPAGKGVGGAAGKAAGGVGARPGGGQAAAQHKGKAANSKGVAVGRGTAAGSGGPPSKRCARAAARSETVCMLSHMRRLALE